MVIFVAKKRNKKIVKFRKTSGINIGVIIFSIIFLYFLYYTYVYFTTTHISAYEVNQGSIAQETTFQGLILRDETIYNAEHSGYVNYYYKDASKASVGNYIYSVDTTGNFYNKISAMNDENLLISDETYRKMNHVVEQYLSGYSDMDFQQTYQFRYDMESALVDALNFNARNEISAAVTDASLKGLHAYPAEKAGLVVYYTDGMEHITVDNFTADMFDVKAYEKNNFLQRETISSGEAAYKMINSEYWNVVIPIDDELLAIIKDKENIKVEFKKDNSTAWGSTNFVTRDGKSYLILEFKNSMIRFATDRYLELELLLEHTTGLKIPNSSITTKSFFSIPKEYVRKGGDSNNDGVLLKSMDPKGTVSIDFVEITTFYETDEVYYIDSNDLRLGCVVQKPDSNEQYTLKEMSELEGVYNINKGYAVFRRIEKLFENQEYTIIASGTSSGIALYDHIALDSSTVQDGDILH